MFAKGEILDLTVCIMVNGEKFSLSTICSTMINQTEHVAILQTYLFSIYAAFLCSYKYDVSDTLQYKTLFF